MNVKIRQRMAFWPALVLACLVGLPGTAAAATAGIDPSYGNGGVAEVSLTESEYTSPVQMVSARQGDAYVLGSSYRCGATACTSAFAIYHYLPDGSRDASFGGGGVLALPQGGLGYTISVDEQGRLLAAAVEPGAVVVRRYAKNGQLDMGFGSGGSVSVPCSCAEATVTVSPARHQRILVEAGGPTAASNRQRPSAEVALTRLRPDGSIDSSFGTGGTVSLRLAGVDGPGPLAVSAKGAILLAGSGCCTAANAYAIRVSARGRLDTRFRSTAKRALRRLARFGEFPEVRSVLSRGDGTIDLLGHSQFERGFDLRLRASGRLATHFGRSGAVRLPMPVSSASLGTNGAIVAANERGSGTVFRIFRNGSLDPAFGGAAGIEVPRPDAADEVVIGTQAGGRALLMDLGRHFCRYGGCPPTPRLAAFLEGSARR